MRYEIVKAMRALAAQFGQPAPAGAYWRIWRAIVEGRLPATKVRGVWTIADEHLPAVAEILGMTSVNGET
jgi:hypothetical protein